MNHPPTHEARQPDPPAHGAAWIGADDHSPTADGPNLNQRTGDHDPT